MSGHCKSTISKFGQPSNHRSICCWPLCKTSNTPAKSPGRWPRLQRCPRIHTWARYEAWCLMLRYPSRSSRVKKTGVPDGSAVSVKFHAARGCIRAGPDEWSKLDSKDVLTMCKAHFAAIHRRPSKRLRQWQGIVRLHTSCRTSKSAKTRRGGCSCADTTAPSRTCDATAINAPAVTPFQD